MKTKRTNFKRNETTGRTFKKSETAGKTFKRSEGTSKASAQKSDRKPSRSYADRAPAAQKPKERAKPVRTLKQRSDIYVWGRHIVESFLTSMHENENSSSADYALHLIVDKAKKAPAQLKQSVDLAKSLGIKTFPHMSAEEWPLGDNEELNHQRICLKIPEFPTSHLHDVIEEIPAKVAEGRHCVGLILDQIQDPQNVGAILRSAAYFGVQFVLFGKDRQAPMTAHVLKTSAGGAFHVKAVEVTNINRAIEALQKAGVWIVGTKVEGDGKTSSLQQIPKDRPYAIVLGNEAKGMRAEVSNKCDFFVHISGNKSAVESLNVSVATGIILSHFNARD